MTELDARRNSPERWVGFYVSIRWAEPFSRLVSIVAFTPESDRDDMAWFWGTFA